MTPDKAKALNRSVGQALFLFQDLIGTAVPIWQFSGMKVCQK
jgi:hypothetical protein